MFKLFYHCVCTFYFVIVFLEIFECTNDQCSKDDCKEINLSDEKPNKYLALEEEILVFTVATEETDGFVRYLQTAKEYGIEPHVLGMGVKWKGGDNIKQQAGGGWKINLLRNALEKYKNQDDNKRRIILFTDGYDVIFLSGLKKILSAFKKMEADVLFGAEAACWPDKNLASEYPEVKTGKPYLNSGLYIGYLDSISKLLEHSVIGDTEDDQLYFTKAYLDEKFRNDLKMKLDHNSEIFQNLNGATSEISLLVNEKKENEEELYIENFLTLTHPLILHGNGPSKLHLNAFANYLGGAWNTEDGCRHCKDRMLSIEGKSLNEMPVVYVALFVESPTPFLLEQLKKINELEYPKKKIHLFIYNNAKFHVKLIDQFHENHKEQYLSMKLIRPEDSVANWNARDLSLDQCLLKNCDYYFAVESVAQLDNPYTLKLLIEQNRTVVAPLLARPGKAWSNFWGALTTDGFYARSNDYMDIVHNEKRGLWNVPFVGNCYLINSALLKKYDRSKLHFSKGDLDSDMAFCSHLRDLDVFLFVSNRVDFGHLITAETFDTTLAVPDMYQIFENQKDWEARYIHKDYAEHLNPETKPLQPCPDVYWFPMVTSSFCNDLIQMMESFGQWSEGKNNDVRLEGGYEAVPTRDIHMNQVGWERHWLYILQQYVRPIQEHVFTGYFHDPPNSLMNFVVRYRPDEQPSLRPHHDSSTYTINLALNERGVDYEGGGCRFLRYNCSVVETKPGWLLIHPGRLTHYHEGLIVTKGTRYIMISFVDP